MKEKVKRSLSTKLLCIGLAMMLLGSVLAAVIQTDFGNVELKEVELVTSENASIAGLLYIPKGASAENPRPAIICVHGGNSNRQAQSSFAIEFARRGYVAFSIDTSKNGRSSQTAAASNGHIAAIEYIQSLDFVDQENIGAEGHSMGGFILSAIANNGIQGIKSVLLNGVSVGFNEGVDPSPESLHVNICYVIGQYDENAGPTNWKVNGPRYAHTAPDVKLVFGTDDDIKVGEWYGSAEENNLRIMYQPAQFHTWMLYSPAVVKLNLDFFATTMEGGSSLDSGSQIWMWKEVGTAVSYIGLFLIVFALMGILLGRLWFRPAITERMQPQMKSSPLYWICVLLMAVVPIIAVQPIYLKEKEIFSKVPYLIVEHINGVLLWQLVTVAIILVINIVMKKMTKEYDWTQDKKLYVVEWKSVGRSALVAAIAFGLSYTAVHLAYFFFKAPVEFLQAEADLFTLLRFQTFLAYLPFYGVYYLLLGYVQMSGLDVQDGSGRRLYLLTTLTNALGIVLFALVFYGSVPIYGISLLHSSRFVGGVLVNFIPGILICSILQVYAYRKTGNIYTGAFTSALIFTWMSVASGCLI